MSLCPVQLGSMPFLDLMLSHDELTAMLIT
jgi:hypothetical protein